MNVKWLMGVGLLSVAVSSAGAGELLLGAAGRSRHRIVVPDQYPDARIEASVRQAADLMQRAFKANEIELAIVSEAEADGDAPGIYVGQTEFARKHGVDFAGMEGWTYVFKVAGRDLIVAGNDRPDPIPLEKRRDREARQGGIPFLGSLKAVTEFLYQYAGTRFVCLGAHGIEFLPTPVIYVPDDLDVVKRTYGRNIEVSRSKDIYYIANGLEPSPTTLSNYGHYHQTVISAKEHGSTHPEYFIFQSRRRDHRGGHFCFSNPDVRELIYQKVLEDCDTGYDIIEMGQNDGFRPCGCDKCHALYGVSPTYAPEDGGSYLGDAAWGEKLWIMHRDMALRLAKDRPDKKLMICAYSVARNPPRTIDRLPENVIVQMMGPTPEIFGAWDRIDVPGGYAAYLYTWGTLTPKNSIRHIETLTDTLVANGVRAVQINGKPRGLGIEGVNVYVFRRRMNDPGAKSVDELVEEYIDAAYREAAGPMHRFYRKLHQRLDFRPEASTFAHRNRNPLLAYNTLYTPELMNELEAQLANAEAVSVSPAVAARLAATRYEFDYLKHLAWTILQYHAYLMQPDDASLDRALSAVEARNAWLASIEPPRPSFTWYGTEGLKTPRGLGVEPLNWDTARLRAEGLSDREEEVRRLTVPKAAGEVTPNAPLWETVPAHALRPSRDAAEALQDATAFQVAYDDENLYVRVAAELPGALMDSFDSRGRDAELWLQESIHILVAPEGDKSQYYYLTYEPVENSYIDAAHGFITDPLHPKFGWNDQAWDGEWTYVNDLRPDQNAWISMATIPFSTLGVSAPKSGDVWAANFGRVHYKAKITDTSHSAMVKNREISAWTGTLNASNNPGEASMGDLAFE